MKYLTKNSIKLPKRNPESHKGQNGRVAIIGGSLGYTGTLALAGIAALRSGADIVTVFAPSKVAWALNCLSADLVTKKLDGDYLNKRHIDEIIGFSKNIDAILIGNGMAVEEETKEFARIFFKKIKNLNKKLVIDADGIKVISINDANNAIITPHILELKLLLKNSRISENIIKKIINEKNIEKKAELILKTLKSRIKNNIILLKGPIDAIISKNKIAYNKTGNAGMTKAGTGDVLAGLCVGFLAQSRDLWQSAVNAAYFNGLIGDILLKKHKGYSYLASDMAEEIRRLKF
ncbi:MAG: NAD(P)H-hydrate dehydratase [Candidatus Woesearchaeota archaeon]|nr:NAD(P)H-hydrate dehydratase [Candidatus Woesearchaeota archaeon]